MTIRRILSCDGGGIRGLMTAMMIQKLDQEYGIITNSKVDLFAGTSTGGIIALALAANVPISTIVGIYSGLNAQTIFTPLEFQWQCVDLAKKASNAAVSASALKELTQAEYNNIGAGTLQSVLTQYISPTQTLADLPHSAMVTTFRLLAGQTGSWTPLTLDNLLNSPTDSSGVLDAALSTSAAPTYFPPYQHPQYGYCVDGGVFANNPAPLALARAIDSGTAALGEIALLSLGTGLTPSNMQVSSAVCCGIMKWLWPFTYGSTPSFALLNILMDGVSIVNDFQCSQLLGSSYQRANPPLSSSIPLDGWQDVAALEQAVNEYMQSPEWVNIVEPWVKANFS